MISAMLDAYEIPFFIRGGSFSKLYPGMHVKDYNTQTFMVHIEYLDITKELLSEFIAPDKLELNSTKRSTQRSLRVLLEAVFFGWIVTGRRWKP